MLGQGTSVQAATGQLYAETVTPNALRFQRPKVGPPSVSKECRAPAVNSQYATNSDKTVRIRLRPDNLINLRRGCVKFTVTVSNLTNQTYCRLAQGIWSIWDWIKVWNGSELEYQQNYGLQHSMIFETFRQPEVGDVDGPLYGYGTQAERNYWATQQMTYQCPLLLGLFLSSNFPAGLLQQQIELQLQLNDPTRFVETDSSTTPVITLTNIYLHYDVLYVDDGIWNSIKTVAASSGICMPYKSFNWYNVNVLSQNNTFNIPHVSGGIETLYFIVRDGSAYSSMTTNDKFLTWLNDNVYETQLQINNDWFPTESVKYGGATPGSDTQGYYELLKLQGTWMFQGNLTTPCTISPYEFNTNRFLIPYQMNPFPGEGLISPITTTQNATSMNLKFNMSGVPPANRVMDIFVCYSKNIEFRLLSG